MCKDPITVERRLNLVCRKLNVTEINIGLFNRMIKEKVATNDVRNFSDKQHKLKHSYNGTKWKLSEVAMKQKLKDAYSTADRLRREKKRVKGSFTDRDRLLKIQNQKDSKKSYGQGKRLQKPT